MRLESVRARRLGPFNDFTLDLTGPGRVVAITGENGVGKSTILELGLPGTLYRSTPTRGSLVDLATARDAQLETRLVNGSAWTIRHLVDKVSQKSEAFVLDANGVSVLPDSKVRSFDAWAASHLPAPEVLFACMFSAQGADGFLKAKPGERKATLLRILGVERLEGFARRAGEHEREARAALELNEARIADERERGGHPLVIEGELKAARAESTRLDQELEAARSTLALAEEDQRKLDEHNRTAAEQTTKRAELGKRIEAARARITDLEGRLANNQAVLAQRDAIRAAVAERDRLQVELSAKTNEAHQAEADARREAATLRDADQRLRAVVARIERADETLRGRAAVETAVASIGGLARAVTEADTAVSEAQAAFDALQGRHIAGAEERVTKLRGGATDAIAQLERRADGLSILKGTIAEDDRVVALAQSLPAQVEAASGALRSARERKEAADKKLAEAHATAARQASIAAASEDRAGALDEQRALADARDGAVAAEQAATVSARALRGEAGTLEAALQATAELAKKAEPLAKAEARIAELEPQLTAARDELAGVEAELERTPEWPPGWRPPDVAGARLQATAVELKARAAHAAVAVVEQRHAAALEGVGRLSGLTRERERLEADLADWTLLSADLGKNGLQAAEIDAAGPELTELVNDLLHTCHGPRFTVRVETQRASADGKRMLEGCECVVLDTEHGREAPGETFSGGECAFINEALSLALSMLACRRAGIERPTLVRDESAAALSAKMRPLYVPMLRRAAELVNADKILFVSHFEDVIEMADARIEVG